MVAMLSGGAFAQQAFFNEVQENTITSPQQQRQIIPARYRTLQLNTNSLAAVMSAVPTEKTMASRAAGKVIELPMPNGGSARFHIWESAVMDPALAARYPGIKTFTGQGIDDPAAVIKLDLTPAGFHAMVLPANGNAVFIDPYAKGNTLNYIVYHKRDFKKNIPYFELPPVKHPATANRQQANGTVLAGICVGAQLRTYRLALAATGEYTAAQGGTVAGALAAQATTMNRVNGVYEKEVAIRMVLIANSDLLIYTDGTTDPYTNNNGNTMLNENQTNINSVIGNANYDIGHVFSTGGGGIAGLGVVCITGQKAKGVTGSSNPVNDPFDIDYVAHEMGHQFGGNHTFNSLLDNCGSNGELSANAEPGSGSSIMAYAGICATDNLQLNSDPQFHAISFNEITTYTINGSGNGCALVTATGNTPPVANAGVDYVIPRSTPFVLSGSATDADGHPLLFSWEQINVGGPFGGVGNPSGNAPIFRSFAPQATPVRYFPTISDVVNNVTTRGELLPSYGRALNFRLTARDNRAGGGGVCFDEATVTVNGTAGPFVITNPNAAGISWLVNDFKTITWNPAGTDVAPINCTNVKIDLSLDGGFTFPVTLAASTPNDGIEEIVVPANTTGTARIRISAVGNVFYDMSNANLTIQNAAVAEFVFNNPPQVTACGGNSAMVTIKTGALNGFATAINLSATGAPAGTSVSFGTSQLAPGGSSTVTLNNINTLAPGAYNITIIGVAGAVSKTRVVTFVVSGTPVPPVSLSSPSFNATGVATQPSFNWTAVPAAGFYTLEIATDNAFATIVQFITNITTLPRVLTTPLAENTVFYWRVKTTNDCGTGAYSSTGIFKTGIGTCKNSTDLPKNISSSGTPTVTSTLVILPVSGVTISDLNVVGLKASHSYVNDLTVTLTSPAGTNVVLFDRICNNEPNLDINLDDEAVFLSIPCPPTGGQSARPQNLLSVFDGESSTGTWTLTVKDNESLDGGSLTGWGLTFNNCAVIATPISNTPWTQLCGPTAATTLTAAANGTTYQWQLNSGSGFVNIPNNGNYAGVTTATLQISNAPSSWNGYQYRAVVDGVNGTSFTLGFTNTWVGTVSAAWETPANWSCNSVPDANTDVIVNTGTVVVNSAAQCRSLRVNPGSNVTVNTGFTLNVVR